MILILNLPISIHFIAFQGFSKFKTKPISEQVDVVALV